MVVVGSLLATLPLPAEVASYSTFKVARFHQASAAPPATLDFPNAYCFGARLFTAKPGEVIKARVTPPIGSARDLNEPGPLSLDFNGGRFFDSKANLDDAFPSGNNVFEINGSAETSRLTIPDGELYPQTVPAVAPETWVAMQSLDACQPFTLTWNGFKRHPAADTAFTFVRIYEEGAYSDPPRYAVGLLDPGTNRCLVPANVLKSATRYRVELIFSNRSERRAAGFGQALAVAGFDELTYASLNTRPPELKLVFDGRRRKLSFPVTAKDFTLEYTDHLGIGAKWNPVTADLPIVNGEFVLTNFDAAPAMFLRLRKAR